MTLLIIHSQVACDCTDIFLLVFILILDSVKVHLLHYWKSQGVKVLSK